MARQRERILGPGDSHPVRLRMKDDPLVINWFNEQSNLTESIIYLIEEHIRGNGVYDVAETIPLKRKPISNSDIEAASSNQLLDQVDSKNRNVSSFKIKEREVNEVEFEELSEEELESADLSPTPPQQYQKWEVERENSVENDRLKQMSMSNLDRSQEEQDNKKGNFSVSKTLFNSDELNGKKTDDNIEKNSFGGIDIGNNHGW